MTSKERIRAAIAHQPVDRIPMMILLGESWLIERKGISFKDLREMDDLGAQMIVDAYDEIECDNVTTGLGCWIGWLEALGCPVEIEKIGAPIEVKACFTDIAEFVETLDHSKIRERLESSELIQKIMKQTRLIKEKVGDSKYVCGQMVAPFSACSMMADVKYFMTLVGKKNPHLPKLLDYMADVCACLGNMYIENGADMVQIPDPCASGDMISPKTYAMYAAPAQKRMFDQFKGHDNTMLHICGKAGMRIPSVIEVGFGSFSVDSPVQLKEALEQAGGKLTMVGNFNPNEALRLGTPEDVYALAYANAEIAGLNGGYIMMPGCDLAATTPVENIKAMVRASKDYAANVRG